MNNSNIFCLLLFVFATQLQAQGDPFASYVVNSSPSKHQTYTEATETASTLAYVNAQEIRLLQQDQPQQTYLLDCRSKEEYQAFQIPGAKWMGQDVATDKVWMLDRKATLILYANYYEDQHINAMARALINMGFQDVRTYKGGIIDWINDGNRVVNHKGQEPKKYEFDNKKLRRLLK